jgi:AraC-like DNA-binding protein
MLSHFPLFETTDLDESREVMGRLWEKHRVECIGRVRFRTRVRHVQVGELGLSFIDCATPLIIEASPTGQDFYLQFLENCATEFRHGGKRMIASPDRAMVCRPDREMFIRTPPARVLSLKMPARIVGRLIAADRELGDESSPLPDYLDLRLPACRALSVATRWAAQEIDASPELLGSAAIPHLEAMLISRFVATLPTGPFALTGATRTIGDAMLKEIENWIHANLQEPLSVELLADRFDISVRSLQLAFRSRRDCSPMAYVRNARLWAVRCELRQANVGAAPLRFVAAKYGLVHLGRFAAHYRDLFGELPSETLAKAIHP